MSLAEKRHLLIVKVDAGVSCASLKVQVTQRPVVGEGGHCAVSIWTFYVPSDAAEITIELRVRHNTEVKSLDSGIQQLSYLIFSGSGQVA